MRKKNKVFYLFVLIIIFTLSVGFAILNRTLNVSGYSAIKKTTWDLHFENLKVSEGSVVATKEPIIDNDKLTVDFSFSLNMPGDFYEFTVDVKNGGTIDAMIDSLTKTPELTDSQKKYLNYIIEYENGEQITSKQIVKKNRFLRFKVRVEYRTDIEANDLPVTNENLNLGFVTNYVQADSTGTLVTYYGAIVDSLATIKAFDKEWEEIPGLTLYDAVRIKHEEMNYDLDYATPSEYFIQNFDFQNVFVDNNGKILNLKNTILEGNKTYDSSTFYFSYTLTEERIYTGNHSTVFLDVYTVVDINNMDFSLDDENVVFFADYSDTYIDVVNSVSRKNSEAESELLNEYVLGIKALDDAGCSVDGVHRFFVFADDNFNFLKITDNITNLEKRNIYILAISKDEMTWEEAKMAVQQKMGEML